MKNNNAVQHNNQTASEQTLSPDEGHVLHKVRDPVCGMAILPDRAHSSIRYQDHQLYFCSASCESKFKAHPDRYLTEDASEHSHHHHHDHHEVSPDQIKQPHHQAEKENSEGVDMSDAPGDTPQWSRKLSCLWNGTGAARSYGIHGAE